MQQTSDQREYTGLPGGPGRAIGPAFLWNSTVISPVNVENPREAVDRAFMEAAARLDAVCAAADSAPLQAQRLMLGDPDLREGVRALLDAGMEPCAAVSTVADQLAEVLESADSEYFRERSIDVRAIGRMLAEIISGVEKTAVPRGSVVIAEELSPVDTAQLAEAGVAAFVTMRGGPTCHAAIMARAWGIPAVVGAPANVLSIPAGTPVLVDGDSARVVTHPNEDISCVSPVVSVSIPRIPLLANIGSAREALRAAEAGAEGVGLLRTEFLFQERAQAPSEDEQAQRYAEILAAFPGQTVIARTLDIGADKPVAFLPLPGEPNPQLGLRGIRLCLRHPELFRTQLRALLRASRGGALKIMLPMVTTVEEVRRTRALINELSTETGIPAPPVGAMIEVPMAALAARELASECDFFSLGTNDLLQFLLAADRQHEGVGYLHAQDHPAVWNLIAHVIESAHAAQIPVGVCGEWGSDPATLARLVEMGIDSASVSVGALARVRGWFGE